MPIIDQQRCEEKLQFHSCHRICFWPILDVKIIWQKGFSFPVRMSSFSCWQYHGRNYASWALIERRSAKWACHVNLPGVSNFFIYEAFLTLEPGRTQFGKLNSTHKQFCSSWCFAKWFQFEKHENKQVQKKEPLKFHTMIWAAPSENV